MEEFGNSMMGMQKEFWLKKKMKKKIMFLGESIHLQRLLSIEQPRTCTSPSLLSSMIVFFKESSCLHYH